MKRVCSMATPALLVLLIAACATTQPYPTSKFVTSFALSPGETLLAVADANEIRLISADTKKNLRTLRELPPDPKGADTRLFRHGVADSLVFLDEDRIATTGMGGLATVWNVHSGKRLTVIDSLPGEEFASTIDYSPAFNQLAIGTSEGQILIATISNNHAEPILTMAKLEGYVYDLQFSRNGLYLASASFKPGASKKYESTEDTAETFFHEVNTTGDNGSADKTGTESAEEFAQNMNRNPTSPSNVVIWDTVHRERLGALKGAEDVMKMALVPGEPALITAGDKVQIWEFMTRKQTAEISDPNMVLQGIGLGALAVASLATLSVGAMPAGDFFTSSLLSGGYPFIPTMPFISHVCARAAAISPDGLTIVTTTRGPTLNVMSVIDRKENKVIEKWTANATVCGLRFTGDGKHLLEANTKGIFLYDTKSWKKSKL